MIEAVVVTCKNVATSGQLQESTIIIILIVGLWGALNLLARN